VIVVSEAVIVIEKCFGASLQKVEGLQVIYLDHDNDNDYDIG